MKIGDHQLVKRINRSVLLRLMRANPGASRVQLSNLSGLTKSTVSTAVRELIDEGWLEEDGHVKSNEKLSSGRPSMPLVLSSKHHAMAGIEVAVDGLRLAVVSVTGDILWSQEHALSSDSSITSPTLAFAQAAELLMRTRNQLDSRGLKLSAAGLALPGGVDASTGLLRIAPNLGWRNEPVGQLWQEALANVGLSDLPTAVQNEANCAALGEYEFSRLASTDALIFIICDVGVGAGIVLNDRIYTGAHGLAGEIGHSVLLPGGDLCSCGRRGCVETFIGARAMQRELRQTGDVAQAGQALGVLMQNLWVAFNPGMLVIGGKSISQCPALRIHAQACLSEYAAAAGMAAPPVNTARHGLFSSAVGAAALVLHHQLRPALGDIQLSNLLTQESLSESLMG